MKQKLTPVVKWAGGKKQLLGKLTEHLPAQYNRYYEPFIGGGALLLDIQPDDAVINDVNTQLVNLYNQLKQHVDAVIAEINAFDTVSCDKEYYLSMRERYNEKIKNNELDPECAALMIWTNKHCFNGLYRVNSKGLFNVPYNNKVNGSSIDEENLRGISRFFNEKKIEIFNDDFEKICKSTREGDFEYFDSPYIPESDTANFTDYAKNGFTLDDHIRLAELYKELSENGVFVMLSNNNVPLVHELYEGFNITETDARRNINRNASKRTGKEVIITNY